MFCEAPVFWLKYTTEEVQRWILSLLITRNSLVPKKTTPNNQFSFYLHLFFTFDIFMLLLHRQIFICWCYNFLYFLWRTSLWPPSMAYISIINYTLQLQFLQFFFVGQPHGNGPIEGRPGNLTILLSYHLTSNSIATIFTTSLHYNTNFPLTVSIGPQGEFLQVLTCSYIDRVRLEKTSS